MLTLKKWIELFEEDRREVMLLCLPFYEGYNCCYMGIQYFEGQSYIAS